MISDLGGRPVQIEDNRTARRFELRVDGHLAWLSYDRGTGTLLIHHTEVPIALAGRGIGSMLVRHAVQVAESEHRNVQSDCPFATAFLQKHGVLPPPV